MNLKRTPLLAIALGLTLVASFPSVPAGPDENLATEHLGYVANDLVVGLAATPCDDDGIGGVAFCQALAEENLDDRPHRIFIDIREEAGPRVAGYYMYIDADGNAMSSNVGGQGYFCGSINHYVPVEARELIVFVTPVDVDAFLDFAFDTAFWVLDKSDELLFGGPTPEDPETSGAACGSVGTIGTVTAVWRYNAPVECIHIPC